MPSLREERLQERVAEIRPQLAKAREIAETADTEGRAMTIEEQKSYDEIMAKGREVADALKAHRHDQEVFAFARELSDEVGLSGLGGDLSSVGLSGQVTPTFLQGHGHQGGRLDARARRSQGIGPQWCCRRRPGVPTGSGRPGCQVATGLLDVLPFKQHTSPEYAYLAQTSRTNNAAVVAEGATKPTSGLQRHPRRGCPGDRGAPLRRDSAILVARQQRPGDLRGE